MQPCASFQVTYNPDFPQRIQYHAVYLYNEQQVADGIGTAYKNRSAGKRNSFAARIFQSSQLLVLL